MEEGLSAGEEVPVGELMEIIVMIKVLGIHGQIVLVFGHGTGLAADCVGVRGASFGVGAGDGSGLNPNRIRGFGVQQAVG